MSKRNTKNTPFTQDEVDQGSLDPSTGLDLIDEEEEQETTLISTTAPSQPARKGQKCMVVQSPKANQKKTTKAPSPHPKVNIAALSNYVAKNITLPKVASNGQEIQYLETEPSFRREDTKKLNTLERGETIEIYRWRQIRSQFGNGVSFILYTKPDEEGNERAFWSITLIDNYIQEHKPNMEEIGFSITKLEESNFKVGTFTKY